MERKRARNRTALVAAARRVFARDGFDRATIAEIAEAADLGFGTFYRYFPDKHAILEAVLDEGRQDMDAVLSAPENDTGSGAAALARFTGRFVRVMARNQDIVRLMWQIALRDSSLLHADPFPVRLRETLTRIVARGVDQGEFPPGDVEFRARFVASLHLALSAPDRIGAGDEGQLIRTMTEFELRALGARMDPVEEGVS